MLLISELYTMIFLPAVLMKSFPGGSDDKESACKAGDLGLIPGSRKSPGEGNCNPLQSQIVHKFKILY